MRRKITGSVRLCCEYCGVTFSMAALTYKTRTDQNKGIAPKHCSRACAQNKKYSESMKYKTRLRNDLLIARPVTCLKDMSPEKRAEMIALYSSPVFKDKAEINTEVNYENQ